MDHALLEVKKAIHHMDPSLEFAIVFFDAKVESPPGKQAVKANDANKRQMFAWADRQGDAALVAGPPILFDALRYSLQTFKPNTIFLLTAGDVPNMTYNLRALGQMLGTNGETIHVINFGGLLSESYLRQFAMVSGGQYQFVPDIVP